ncbi:hypothetical protein MY3296_001678 [Beauveria thailandica]
MASVESVAAKVSVGEVAAMNDAELAKFMQGHRLPDGDYDLPVEGWDKLSKDERSRLAQRLEAQKRSLAQSPTVCSRPLDLNDLDARLRQVSPSKSFLLRPETQTSDRSRSPTPPFDRTRREVDAYDELIDDGGRPLYPIGLIQKVYKDPDNYAEILWPWQEYLTPPVSPSGIFQRQWRRWRDFRKWQNDNRGREDDDGGFQVYVERQKYIIQRDFLPDFCAKRLAEIEADPSCLKSRWEGVQWERERQRHYCRERGCRGFRDYAEAVKRRLTRHDFRQPFKLDKDPKKQDKLTTWIEYLNYEYWWLDKHTGDIERLEPEHDRLWQELGDEIVLRPHETKEFVRTTASPMERANEREQAEKVVEREESEAKRIYVLTQKDPKRLSIPQAKRISMMKHSTERLLAAKQRLKQVQSRNQRITQFIRATFDFADAKRDAARHRVLVQWVLDQVPLVEAEMEQSKVNRREPDGRRRTKRKLDTDQDTPKKQPTKRRRLAIARASSKVTETTPKPPIVMDQEASRDSQPKNLIASGSHQGDVRAMLQGPRRSSRIAARRDTLRIALQPHTTQPRSRSKLKGRDIREAAIKAYS